MRKRDELSDPKSCLSRARDDECLFVLLGRDVAAPAAVRAWIGERLRLGKNGREDAQIVEAEEWIAAVTLEQTQVRRDLKAELAEYIKRKAHSSLPAREADCMAQFLETNRRELAEMLK
jgi:hypothetical protein